ncbi:MAG: CPBP family intramembrane metalloprotease [Clostridiales bacterium]|nr:CPBP family intramembrane metalloprotease [Clostridiales bacterium]
MCFVKGTRHGALFVTVTILWTWGLLSVPALLGLDFENTVTQVAYTLGGASPSIIGLIFVLLSGDREYMRSFLCRIVMLGKIGKPGFVVLFALVPAVTVLSAFISQLFTSAPPDWSKLSTYLKDPASLIAFVAFTLIFGPLAEELGWRGYLLDCWKDRGILVYGAGIGLIWTVWHLPMFFIAGSYQNSLLMHGAEPVLCFTLSTIALGVIIGEITKRSGGILAAVLFHFTVNFTGELSPLTLVAELIRTVAFTVIALGMIFSHYHTRKGVCNGNHGST